MPKKNKTAPRKPTVACQWVEGFVSEHFSSLERSCTGRGVYEVRQFGTCIGRVCARHAALARRQGYQLG